MKRFLVYLLLLSSALVMAENLLQNPDFAMEKGYIKKWSARQSSSKVVDKTLQISLKKGQTIHVYNEKVILNQTERQPINFGIEYKGFCNAKGWEHCIVLADLTYQDGTKEGWAKVLLPVPQKSDDFRKLEKTVKLPKPVKSFRYLILLKDETEAAFRNPYVTLPAAQSAQSAFIVLPAKVLDSEKFAAEELALHIERLLGKRPLIVSEEKKLAPEATAIYLGKTRKAASCGFDFSKFPAEKWLISSVDNGLVIGGGETCGTLYGVYNYLEKVCGVRWYSVTDTKIPKLKELPLKDLQLAGKPAFRYRALITEVPDYDSTFLLRNRQNSDFFGWKFSLYDGIPYIGHNIHTHCIWVKPAKYFKSNPEFFALDKNGKRTPGGLCLMNKNCRQTMIKEVREVLKKRYAEAAEKPLSSMQLVNISHMDNQQYCHCKDCKDFAAKYKALSACDIDFINEVATALKDEFPNVIFQTLAYTYTEKPPVGLAVADNVCVEMCDTTSNVAVPVTHPDNVFFLDSLTEWTKIAKNVMIWDYWITYNFADMSLHNELPCATIRNTAKDLRTFRRLNIPLMLSEMEYSTGTSDIYDCKSYIYLKLLENPYLDENKLTAEFANDFYGKAGKLFLEYRSRLAEVQKKWHPYIPWDAHYGRFTYLDSGFLKEMQDLFDRGEQLLAADPVSLKRWRHARISLDRAVCLRISYLMEEFLRTGKPIEEFPFDLVKCANRIKKAMEESIAARYDVKNIRLLQKNSAAATANLLKKSQSVIEKNYKRMTMMKPAVPTAAQLPAELANVPKNELHIFPLASAFMFLESSGKRFKLIPEKDSLFGCVAARTFDTVKEKNILKGALQVFSYKTDNKAQIAEAKLPSDILTQPGWHWVKFSNIKVSPNNYLAISSSWECQFDISCLAGIEHKTRTGDVYLRVRCKKIDQSKSQLEYDTVIFKQ